MEHDLQLEMRSDPVLLCASRAMVRAYLERNGFPAPKSHEIVLAVDEAVTNAIRHSYSGKTTETVTVNLSSEDDWIEIEIIDNGAPAPAEKVARKEQTAPHPDAVTPGGLGVQLIYEVCDEVKFGPGEGQGNRVCMRIRRPTDEAQCPDGEKQRNEG